MRLNVSLRPWLLVLMMSTHQHSAVCHCCEFGSRACTCSNHERKNICGRYLICSHFVNPEPLCSRRQHPGLVCSKRTGQITVSVSDCRWNTWQHKPHA